MRVHGPRMVVALSLLLALVAGPVASLTAFGPVTRSVMPVRAGVGCVAGTQLLTNPSFELPGLNGADQDATYRPTGWAGSADAFSARNLTTSGRTVDGQVYIFNLRDGLTQAVPTSGLGGEIVTLSFLSNASFLPTVTFGGETVTYTGSGNGPYTATLVVPTNAATTTLAFTRLSAEVDGVSLTCGGLSSATPPASASASASGICKRVREC